MSKAISAMEAKDRVSGEAETAFLDVREAGPFSEGHPLFAVLCTWSGFEPEAARLVPRRCVPVTLIDGGDGIAAAAADALECMGYGDVSVIEGGAPAWAAAGFTLFKGVHVPSKTLGELAEQALHPSAIRPEVLAGWMSKGGAFLFFDCRPAAEHRVMTVPGAICLPNGELPHRLDALPADLPIVLTCAGRTRGIIGAASLGLIAPGRSVHWLKDGTQGWRLAGYDLQYDNPPTELPPLDDRAAEATRSRARAFIDAHGIPLVTASEISAMRADDNRTTFFFDIRTAEEERADPLPGFAHAPVVQLVQATDRFMAVRRARVVLADDLGLRGAIAAYWLRALGYEPAVALISDRLRSAGIEKAPGFEVARAQRICASEALRAVAGGRARLVDLRSSNEFVAGHVAGALWSIRPRLREITAPFRLLIVGDETPRADLACATLRQQGRRDVAVVNGGMPALIAAGATLDTANDMPLSEACDVISFALGRQEGNRNASRLYLSWERGLIDQLSAEERTEFQI